MKIILLLLFLLLLFSYIYLLKRNQAKERVSGYKEQRLVQMFTGLMKQLVQKRFFDTTTQFYWHRTAVHCIQNSLLGKKSIFVTHSLHKVDKENAHSVEKVHLSVGTSSLKSLYGFLRSLILGWPTLSYQANVIRMYCNNKTPTNMQTIKIFTWNNIKTTICVLCLLYFPILFTEWTSQILGPSNPHTIF